MAETDIATTAPTATTGFPSYLYAHGGWFLAFGLQMVLFPYLVRVILEADEIHFGLAQMSMQLPTALLILVGGFVADRVDSRRVVVVGCAVAAAAFAVLATIVISGGLTYGLMIGYALVIGTIGAFVMPARDGLLSRVAPGGVHQGVAFASIAQFAGQILGMGLATLTPILGVAALLAGQGVLMASASYAATRVRPRPAGARRVREGSLLGFMASEIGGGFAAARASPVIAPVMICAVGMGLCFMGAFAVLLPLIVQSYFPAHLVGAERTQIAVALGIFNLLFWVGSFTSAMLLVRFGHVRRKGAAYLLSLSVGALVLIACSLPMPLWVLYGLNFIWGLGGGVAMTLGRGLVQHHAPPEKLARVLSIFVLGNMGAAPLGAVAYGFLAHAIGPKIAILIPGFGMLAIVGAVAVFSKLWRLDEAEAGAG